MKPINEYFWEPEPEVSDWSKGYMTGWNDAMKYVKENGMEATDNLL